MLRQISKHNYAFLIIKHTRQFHLRYKYLLCRIGVKPTKILLSKYGTNIFHLLTFTNKREIYPDTQLLLNTIDLYDSPCYLKPGILTKCYDIIVCYTSQKVCHAKKLFRFKIYSTAFLA